MQFIPLLLIQVKYNKNMKWIIIFVLFSNICFAQRVVQVNVQIGGVIQNQNQQQAQQPQQVKEVKVVETNEPPKEIAFYGANKADKKMRYVASLKSDHKKYMSSKSQQVSKESSGRVKDIIALKESQKEEPKKETKPKVIKKEEKEIDTTGWITI